jgi:hypothetical protein
MRISPLLLVLSLCCAGCSRGEKFVLVPVEGVVTLDGEPLADARVVFFPSPQGRPSSGRTDADGRFQLSYLEGQMGALAGKHKVSISTLIEADLDSDDPEVQQGREEFIPPEYNSQTTLEVELEPGPGEMLEFPLVTAAAT